MKKAHAIRQSNVLHIIGTARPGGVETLVQNLAKFRDRDHYAMTVCVLGDEGVVTDALCSYGVRIEVLGRTRNSPLHRARWLLRVIRENSFDIIHAHTGGRLPRLMARIVTGARIISHLHGLPPGMSESFRARKPKAAGFIADAALGADPRL